MSLQNICSLLSLLSNTLRLRAQDLHLVLTVARLYHSAHLLESHQYHFGVILLVTFQDVKLLNYPELLRVVRY